MNRARRELLRSARMALTEAESCVTQALDEEQDCLGNMPENLESSERYEKMEAAVEQMEEALEHINAALESVEAASE